jgi:dipeptide transport system permease protein
MFLAFFLGIIIGVFAAWKRGTKIDISFIVISLATYSMPVFWFGMLLLLFFSYYINVFPIVFSATTSMYFP